MSIKDILQIVLIPITKIWDSINNRNIRKIAKDKEIYQSIKDIFEDGDLIYFFCNHSVSNLTHREYMKTIDKLQNKLESPGFIFTIGELEKLRIGLLKKINEFIEMTSVNFFVNNNNRDYYELKYYEQAKLYTDSEASNKFKTLAEKIDLIGTEIYQIYKELSEQARKKL